jgi:hypothetical protein
LLDPLFCRAKDNRKRRPPQMAYFGITGSPRRTPNYRSRRPMGMEARRNPWYNLRVSHLRTSARRISLRRVFFFGSLSPRLGRSSLREPDRLLWIQDSQIQDFKIQDLKIQVFRI